MALGNFHSVDPLMEEGVSNVTATPSVQLGTRRIVSGEEYVYCYNNTGSAATQGMAMVASGLSGYSLTRSSTAADDFVVCFVKHADVAAGSYFWGLTRGLCSVNGSAAVTGTLFTIGADGLVQTYLVGSFPTGPLIGKYIVTNSGSTASLAFVKANG